MSVLVILLAAAGVILMLAASLWLRRRTRITRLVILPPEPADPWRENVLAHACGPCNNVAAARTCICAGHCGHRYCKGTPVVYDLAGALERITRDGRRG